MPNTCPRAEYIGKDDLVVDAATDPALQYVARCIVAGIDGQFELHPAYESMVEQYGKSKAEHIIGQAVQIPAGIDVIQTEMDYGGVGLFGGLSKDGSRFDFFEWLDSGFAGQMHASITGQDARDIVAGNPLSVVFTFSDPNS